MADEALDDVLSGDGDDKAKVGDSPDAKGDVVVDPDKSGKDDDPDGANKPDGDGDAPPASKENQEPESWTKAAVLDERRKRQEAQSETQALRKQLEEKDVRPDVFEDQEAAFQHLENKMNKARLEDRVTMSREFMLTLKDDYPDMEVVFTDLAKEDSELTRMMLSSPNPAKFAYDTARKHQEWKKVQNVDEYKANLEKEIRAKIEKESKEEQEKSQQRDEKVSNASMPSLASKGSSATKDEGGSEELGDILGR